MTLTIQAQDQATDGRTLREFVLEFLTERVTARDLLRSRVFQEVSEENARRALAADRGKGPRRTASLDYEGEATKALAAFEAGRVLVLVGDRQLEDATTEVVLAPSTTVTFVRLVPLVGG
jgi:hypothetical protein